MIGKGIRCVHVLPASHLKPAVEPSRNDTDRYRPPSDRHGPRNGLLRSVTKKRRRENLQFSFCSFRLLAGVQRAEKRQGTSRELRTFPALRLFSTLLSRRRLVMSRTRAASSKRKKKPTNHVQVQNKSPVRRVRVDPGGLGGSWAAWRAPRHLSVGVWTLPASTRSKLQRQAPNVLRSRSGAHLSSWTHCDGPVPAKNLQNKRFGLEKKSYRLFAVRRNAKRNQDNNR